MDHSHHDVHAHAVKDGLTSAATRLRAVGERITPQRLTMLEVLATQTDYLSADELLVILRRDYPLVHRSTVYRSLDLFVERGLVSRLLGSGGASVYHLATLQRAHDHLHGQCRICRIVINLPPETFDRVKAKLEPGFIFEPDQSALMGVCAACSTNT